MKKLMYAIALPVVLFLAACSPSNPLIGEWESEPMMGHSGKVEFTRHSMISTNSMYGAEQTNEIDIDDYVVKKDKVGIVIKKDGQTATIYFSVIDADTIEQDTGMIKVRLHRKK